MQEYLDLVRDVLENGSDRLDRTGIGTKALFGAQLRFDLRNGFPLVTTKKVHFKSVVTELIWFLQADTNTEFLEKNKIDIWREWQDDGGELGRVYQAQWLDWLPSPTKVVKVIPRVVPQPPIKPMNPVITHLDPTIEIKSSTYGDYYIVPNSQRSASFGGRMRPVVTIQFIQTGYKEEIRKDCADDGRVRDPFFPKVYGKGFLGQKFNEPMNRETKNLHKVWEAMLQRCYSPAFSQYKDYGARGIYVAEEWLNFSVFCKEVKGLPNWYRKKRNLEAYSLDKDYYGSNCYSSSTCVWLSHRHNTLYTSRSGQPFKVTNIKTGISSTEISAKDAANKYSLDSRYFWKKIDSGKPYKGYMLESIKDSKHLYRYSLPINQMEELIHLLKNNPNSRRQVVIAWNPGELTEMALPPCHMFFQCFVDNGFLDLQMYQRSADMMLGVPFNIASYALLTHMLAQVCGLQPRYFIHTFGDYHIYTNHFDGAREQLKRDPRPLPKLVLNPEIKNIFDFKLEDIKLEDYNPHPKISFEVAV